MSDICDDSRWDDTRVHVDSNNLAVRRASRTVPLLVLGLLSGLTGCAGFNQVPSANPPMEQPSPLTTEWSSAGSGETLGFRWSVESHRGATDTDVCARVHLDPPSTDLPPPNNCGKVGVGYDFVSIIEQTLTDNEHPGLILGITDPSVSEVRLRFAGQDELRIAVDKQAFVAVVPDPFAIKTFAAYRRGTRLATYPCPNGGC